MTVATDQVGSARSAHSARTTDAATATAGGLGLALRWLLWLWIALAIAGGFLWAPAARDFVGESSRILFFHVPMAWVSFVAFVTAGVWAVVYLLRRGQDHDHAAPRRPRSPALLRPRHHQRRHVGARRVGRLWNWDPAADLDRRHARLLPAYLVLRAAVETTRLRARLPPSTPSRLVAAPFFYFVLPRLPPSPSTPSRSSTPRPSSRWTRASPSCC